MHPSYLQPRGGLQATAERDLPESTSERLAGAGRLLVATRAVRNHLPIALFQRAPSTKPIAAAPTSAANAAKGPT